MGHEEMHLGHDMQSSAVQPIHSTGLVAALGLDPTFECNGNIVCMVLAPAAKAVDSHLVQPGCSNGFDGQAWQGFWLQYVLHCVPDELHEFRLKYNEFWSKYSTTFPDIEQRMLDLIWGGEAREQVVSELLQRGAVKYYSLHPAGTWLIQVALAILDKAVAVQLVDDLRGIVVRAAKSGHGSYVIQKIIRVLRPGDAPFVAEEIQRHGHRLAFYASGCRVLCRLLELAIGDPSTAALMDIVLADLKELIKDQNGHHVVECALEHGLPAQRARILEELQQDFAGHLWDRNSTYVLQKAMQTGEQVEREAVASLVLTLSVQALGAIATNYYGSAVVQAVMEVSCQLEDALKKRFEAHNIRWRLWSGKAGKAGKRVREMLGSKQ